MKGRSIAYSDEELAWLEARPDMPRLQLRDQFAERFGRHELTVANIASLMKRKGWTTGRTGRFEKGMTPANKGRKMPRHPNSARTRFRKGNRSGRAKERYKPIGTERLSKEGYLERKIHDGMPLQSRWRGVHLINWEALNGPLPEGHALKCLDGDRGNTDPANWVPVPRAMLPRLNGRFGRGYDQAPAELKPTILAVVKLEHAALEARRGRQQGSRERKA